MVKDYLLELGLEEIPARFLLALRDQLSDRVSQFFEKNRINFQSIEAYATPRRLAVIVKGLDEQQDSLVEKIKGPSLRIARNEAGEWTKAAEGFVKGQKLTVDDIIIEQIKDEDYIFVNKQSQGQSVNEIISQIDQVLNEMNFANSMTWNVYTKPFIRPVRWLVSLLEDQVIPFEFIGIKAGQVSQGHRFLGKEVVITSPSTYLDDLEKEFVIADFEARQDRITEQIKKISQEKNWEVHLDSALLEEITAIVEWPHAFSGDFEEKYLSIPDIILVTAMRDHQRYFYVVDKESGKLLPHFISVRNGDDYCIDNVIKGNEKVLRARLDDALFFYNEDQNHSLDFFINRLGDVKEHYLLDSLADKQVRVGAIVMQLAKAVNEVDCGKVARKAAEIYKFDLTSQIVDEFSELQGIIGEIYALEYQIDEQIARAIGEQYLPNQSGGDLPKSVPGSILALSDKLDTLLNYFNVDLIPTGSNDPYALRRQAMGVVEILLANRWSLKLNDFLVLVAKEINIQDSKVIEQLIEFIKARAEQLMERQGIDYDIIQSVLSCQEINIYRLVKFAHHLQELKKNDSSLYQEMVEALTRVVNLGDNEDIKSSKIEISLSETDSEKTLINLAQNNLVIDANQPLDVFVSLIEPINTYFEENMVNSDKRKIQRNRLATMKMITEFTLRSMDPRQLIIK